MPAACIALGWLFFGREATAPLAQLRSFSRSKPELKLIDLLGKILLPLR
jgi:hypothetical protein